MPLRNSPQVISNGASYTARLCKKNVLRSEKTYSNLTPLRLKSSEIEVVGQIKWRSIDEFVVKHAHSKTSFEKFKENEKIADWHTINDVQQTFGAADIIDNERIVFNIGGNRLFAAIGLDQQLYLPRSFIGIKYCKRIDGNPVNLLF